MRIDKKRNLYTSQTNHRISTILLSALALCLILLSACGSNSGNTSKSPSNIISVPAIDPTTKNQGDTQLLAFQQWISLMQQYNRDTTIYHQQLNADQQALTNAKTEAAYKSALSKLDLHVNAIKIPAMKIQI